MWGRKPLPSLTSGVTLCPSRRGLVAGLRLVPKGRLGRGNQTLPATRATQHRGHEALRRVGEESNSSVLTKLCPLSLKRTQPLHPRADGLLGDPFWGGVAWGEAGPGGSSRGSGLVKRTQGGAGVGSLAMPERGAWRGLFAQPHVMPEGRDEPIVRAGVKEGDLGPEIRLGRQRGRDSGEEGCSTEGPGMGRQMQACPAGCPEPRAWGRLLSFGCLPQTNEKVLKGSTAEPHQPHEPGGPTSLALLGEGWAPLREGRGKGNYLLASSAVEGPWPRQERAGRGGRCAHGLCQPRGLQ